MYSKNVKEIVGQLTTKEKNNFIEGTLLLVKQHPNDKILGKQQREHVRSLVTLNSNE